MILKNNNTISIVLIQIVSIGIINLTNSINVPILQRTVLFTIS